MKHATKIAHIFWLVILLCLANTLQAQTFAQLMKVGNAKMEESSYYEASKYFEQAVMKNEENVEANYKLAESLRMFNDYERAATAYKRVLKFDKSNEYPLASFWLGIVLKSVCECKYDDAVAQFRKFRTKYRENDFYSQKAQQEIESCLWAKENGTPKDTITIHHLGKEVNSPYSEFNAVHVYPDKLQYSSLRNVSDDKKKENYLTRIYNQLPNPSLIMMPEGADSEKHIGNLAYNTDVTKMLFTICEADKTETKRCDIFESKFDSYHWSKPIALTSINDPLHTNTHPAFGKDQSGNTVLFFASDRQGGQGGMDIWVSKQLPDGTYGNPINAGNIINTPGNEVTPFYDNLNKTLFFSSDWHYGFGGYDIFKTTGEYTNWSRPTNLMKPINTPQNDLYYSAATDNSTAYLTSNRKGSYYLESETCCNDIYSFKNELLKQNAPKDSIKIVALDTTIKIASTILGTISGENPPSFINESLKKIKQLLPVTLYFHNDEPECCNLRDTTALNYKKTYEGYSALRRVYTEQYGLTAAKDGKSATDSAIAFLFDQKVDKGFRDLVAFSSQLLSLLEKGNKLEVTIKGYCSPLNYNQYNIQLGYRRIASLRNYFFQYREGILLPYISSGMLILKSESMGEETAPSNVSDRLDDTKNSVYSPSAALERKVEVISVEIK